ncbi:PfkB family carbohydrate kinase [Microbacterium elymi]|uniref:PfkB family carbohydrate kinase n=1 Tax=Microbacterium elymi TaxID=2909587 RepID=A0ABY5NI56_9MICO|nr:PfkB family carbohydrate kinase [Microbacterium elymi]UUT34833.1 PfkB family carbohydrate kinase [Microbacterium elymi]
MEQVAPVAVIGDALIDELRDGTSVTELVGGAALNVAVGLVRLGVPATLIAMVGDDEAGQHIRAYLHDYGVGLLASPAPRGSSRAVSTRTGGEPVYEFNAAARGRRVEFGDAERAAIAAAPITAVSCFPFDDAEQVRRWRMPWGSVRWRSIRIRGPGCCAIGPSSSAGSSRWPGARAW